MTGTMEKFLATLAAGTLLLAGCATRGPAPSPKPKHMTAKPPTTRHLEVIAFYDEGPNKASPASFPNLQRFPHLITYLSPFWYKVNPDGSLTANVGSTTLAFARRNHLPLMPLFTNAGGNSAVLLNTTASRAAVNNIVATAVKNNYAGASLDFQLLPASSRAALTRFSQSLATDLFRHGKRHTVNVIPKAQTNAQHGAYNEALLSRKSDGIILMTYDHHSDGSPPGAVAPLWWVRDSLKHALGMGVPRQKIFLGVATYGYDWASNGTVSTVPLKVIRRMGIKPVWSARDKEYHFTYTKNGITHQVWYEDERSLGYKVALAKRYHLRGIAIWRMGYEDRPYWASLQKYLRLTTPRHRPYAGAHPRTPRSRVAPRPHQG